MECYRVKFALSGIGAYALWREGEESSFDDAFVTGEDGLILTFATADACEAYARDHGLDLSSEPVSAFDCDKAVVPPRDADACNVDLALWNAYADASHSLGVPFIGECARDASLPDDIFAIYEKLVCGANLPALTSGADEYRPEWTEGEASLLARVLDEGRALLCRGIGDAGGVRIGVVSDTHGLLPQEVFALFSGQWDEARLRRAAQERYRVVGDAEGRVSLERVAPEAPLLAGTRSCDLILHAGDIGMQGALDELGAIAHTVAVLGNNDHVPYWCSDGDVRPFRSLTFGGMDIAMQHIPADLERSLHGRSPLVVPSVPEMPRLAVHGHTHVPRVDLDGSCVVLCPGSPTQARRGSGHHVALVDVRDGRPCEISLIDLA